MGCPPAATTDTLVWFEPTILARSVCVMFCESRNARRQSLGISGACWGIGGTGSVRNCSRVMLACCSSLGSQAGGMLMRPRSHRRHNRLRAPDDLGHVSLSQFSVVHVGSESVPRD